MRSRRQAPSGRAKRRAAATSLKTKSEDQLSKNIVFFPRGWIALNPASRLTWADNKFLVVELSLNIYYGRIEAVALDFIMRVIL